VEGVVEVAHGLQADMVHRKIVHAHIHVLLVVILAELDATEQIVTVLLNHVHVHIHVRLVVHSQDHPV
jgi:hypothetical protein